ncbi:DinB superfamily protein [Paenibacillus uliginis N3/975]|uniref:DinB superfamily protein n=1 Tax=Paenibacillus uliginis N3/975 TaxID=1313296 RepID=A0A1X7HG36_9BACL|nr:DinB family protein [Paenibacillus uliginis]SMF86117.1 DinB superfamily protein [Paenibacillus uliginis N3/975]
MNTNDSLHRLEELTNVYLDELSGFSEEQLTRKSNDEEWSLGQMYVHLIQSAMFMQIRNIELCMSSSGEESTLTGEKTEAGKAIFAQGSFPPVRIHVPPSPQYTPAQPKDKEQIVEGLHKVLQRMKEIEPALTKLSLSQTVSHPHFGALNGKEWFLLVEMHYRHHLLQKDRLKKNLEDVVRK